MQSAPCLSQGTGIIAIWYVDDLLVFADINYKIEELTNKLSRDLVKKDFGIPKTFLGMDLGRQMEAVYLRPKGLRERMLEDYKVAECKEMTTPTNAKPKLQIEDEPIMDEKDATIYRSIVGSPMYIVLRF